MYVHSSVYCSLIWFRTLCLTARAVQNRMFPAPPHSRVSTGGLRSQRCEKPDRGASLPRQSPLCDVCVVVQGCALFGPFAGSCGTVARTKARMYAARTPRSAADVRATGSRRCQLWKPAFRSSEPTSHRESRSRAFQPVYCQRVHRLR